jgi:hypothetical protein
MQISLLFKTLCLWVIFGLTVAPYSSIAAGASKSEGRDSPFVAQSQTAVTVMRGLRPVGVFQVDVGVVVQNPAQRSRAQALQPVLRDAWRRTTQEFANSYLVPGRVPDAVILGQRLQAATDQVMGPGRARVLMMSVVLR